MNMLACVIDDDPDFCAVAAETFHQLGYQSVWTDEPSRFVSSHRSAYSVIMLDLAMPGIDGIEVMESLASWSDKPQVILVSAYPLDMLMSARTYAVNSGIDVIGVLRKPVSREQIVTVLRGASEQGSLLIDHTTKPMKFSEEDFLHARSKGEFVTFFQPIFDRITKSVVSAEALLRWNHPTHGLLSAGQFISSLRNSSISKHIFPLVLCSSLDFLRRHALPSCDLSISVNVFASDLRIPAFVHQVNKICALYGVPTSKITFELLEYADLIGQNNLIKIITQLRLAGFGVAIDDFGVGLSNLDRLKVLPITELKIDRQFMLDALHSNKGKEILVAIRRIATALGITCTVEGIDSSDLLNIAEEILAEKIQGYLLGGPKSFKEFADLVNVNRHGLAGGNLA